MYDVGKHDYAKDMRLWNMNIGEEIEIDGSYKTTTQYLSALRKYTPRRYQVKTTDKSGNLTKLKIKRLN